jgi:hypothetical protein
MTMDECPAFLVEYLFHSVIPTGLLSLAKLLGLLLCSWSWAFLPTVSAAFFLGSFLLAGALVRAAQATARR